MKKIRVGIIGQGRSGRDIHGAYLSTDARFQIVAVADRMADRRERAVAEYGCDVYADYKKMLKRNDMDLVVNSSFSHMHVPVSIEIFKAGFHVLCEKPAASRARDVDKMVAASKKAKKIFAVYQQSRYAPYFRQIEKVIKSGALGRIVQISCRFNSLSRRWDWQTLKQYQGGNLMNTGPHPLDQVLQLFGEGVPKVHCFMDRSEDGSFGNAENHVKVILSGKGHPLVDLEVSSCCAYPPFTYNVYGTRGGLTGTMSAIEWKYFKPREAPKQKLLKEPLRNEDGTPCYPSEQLKWYSGSWTSKRGKKKQSAYSAAAAPTQGGMTGRFYDMFYKTLTRGTPLEITPAQVRRQIAVIEECQRQNPRFYGKKK